jgi:hypothetical protein
VTKDVQAILDEIDNEQSKADELADRFNASENKVFKDDELDYAASIKKMLDGKEIDEKEAETMRKYKEDIAPQVEETELTEDELATERKELIDAVKKSTIDGSGLSTKDERDTVKELSRLIGTDAVDGLTNTELKNLLKVIDNINNNYLPHYGEIMLEKLDGINNDKVLTNAVEKGKMYKFSQLYSKVKAAVAMQGRTGVLEMIRRNPLFYIDQLFGNFKTKEIFNSLFNEPAKAVAIFKNQLNRVQNILEKAEQKVSKSFKLDPNKTTMSKFKMMTYMVQLEFESNKGNKEVNPASEYLKATIKHIDAGKSRFGERDAEMLQKILNEFAPDGNIDNEKLYNSFNQAEKDAIKDIRGINESLREKAEFTAAIIRGDRIDPLNNYVHLNVLHEFQPMDLTSGSAFVTEYNNAMRASTKAKSLIARTGELSPLNFDVFASAQRGAKFVLMDYNLTRPIRVARRTIKGTIANLEGKGRIPKEQRQIINAINAAFEESIETLLTNTFTQDSFFDIASDYISRQGYRAVLAGTSRFISELSSNIGFAVISDPKALATGVKYRGVIMSSDAPMIMENLKSKQTNRVFPTDTLSGRLVDTSILSQASGIKGAVSKNPVKNKNAALAKYNNQIFYASKEGVFKLNSKTNAFERDNSISTIFDNDEYVTGKMIIDKSNKLWFFTKNYIHYYSSGKLSSELKKNSLPIPSFLTNTMPGYENILQLSDDNYLIGTTDGYYVLNNNDIKFNNHKVIVFGVSSNVLNSKSTNISLKEKGKFKHDENNIAFNYTIPEYDKYINAEYQYKLEGLHDQWSDWSFESHVVFENLPAGDYEFSVRAKVANSVTENISTYSFVVKKPWYSNNWAKFIYFIL